MYKYLFANTRQEAPEVYHVKLFVKCDTSLGTPSADIFAFRQGVLQSRFSFINKYGWFRSGQTPMTGKIVNKCRNFWDILKSSFGLSQVVCFNVWIDQGQSHYKWTLLPLTRIFVMVLMNVFVMVLESQQSEISKWGFTIKTMSGVIMFYLIN